MGHRIFDTLAIVFSGAYKTALLAAFIGNNLLAYAKSRARDLQMRLIFAVDPKIIDEIEQIVREGYEKSNFPPPVPNLRHR